MSLETKPKRASRASRASRPSRARPQAEGFGVVAALLVLVVLSVLGGAIARMSWTQQVSSAQDIDAARAQRAANSGAEWGLYQALRGTWGTCANVSQTLDLRTQLGVWVTVSCNSTLYVEGETSVGVNNNVRVYVIDAVACNGSATCPDNSRVTSVGYVERRRQVQATNQ